MTEMAQTKPAGEMADNVAAFPGREDRKAKTPRVPTITKDAAECIYHRDGWRDIAEWLSGANVNAWVSPSLRKFVAEMNAKKERPTASQLGLLLGTALSVQLQTWIDEAERPEREAEAEMRREVEKEVRRKMAEKRAGKSGESNVVPMA